MGPTEPSPNQWVLPNPRESDPGEDLVGIGADCDPGTMLAGYRRAIFPMDLAPGVLGWYSPDPRGVIPLDRLHVSRSLRRSLRRFRISYDQAFDDVLGGCADPSREGHWISGSLKESYRHLHHLGWAHSVEVWDGNVLAGGLFGVEIGGLFAGESMFHVITDASKAALVGAVARLNRTQGPRLFDVQWWTPHLGSMGVTQIPRDQYLDRLARVLDSPPAFS